MPFDFKPNPEYDGTLSMQYLIDGDSPSAASPEARIAANRLVGTYQTNIYGFIDNQRRLARTSGFPQSSRYMNLPGLEVNHRRNGKHETVSINAKPGEAYAQVTQSVMNRDGYIMVGYTMATKGDFDVTLNGTTIDHYSFPDHPEMKFLMRIYAFGKTALLCHSAADSQNQLLSSGKGLVCNPQRKQVTTPDVGKHDDYFNYFCFKFSGKNNPVTKDDPPFHTWGNSDFAQQGGEPTLEKIKWWPNPVKSPLDITTGKNQFHIPDGDKQSWVFAISNAFTCMEFFSGSNQDLRIANSAWTRQGVNASLGGVGGASVNYQVNDKPLMNGSHYLEYTHTFPGIFYTAFDLSKDADHSNKGYGDYAEYGNVTTSSDYLNSKDQPGTPGGNEGMQEFTSWSAFKQALKGG